jgi:hypothetical protein
VGGYRVARLVRHQHFSLTWLAINWGDGDGRGDITLRILSDMADAVLAFVRLANTAPGLQIHAFLKNRGENKKEKLPHGNQHKQRQYSTSTVQLLSQSPSKVVRSLGSCRRWPFFLLLSQFFFFSFSFVFYVFLCFVFLGFCAFCFDSYSDDTAW